MNGGSCKSTPAFCCALCYYDQGWVVIAVPSVGLNSYPISIESCLGLVRSATGRSGEKLENPVSRIRDCRVFARRYTKDDARRTVVTVAKISESRGYPTAAGYSASGRTIRVIENSTISLGDKIKRTKGVGKEIRVRDFRGVSGSSIRKFEFVIHLFGDIRASDRTMRVSWFVGGRPGYCLTETKIGRLRGLCNLRRRKRLCGR